MLHENFGKKHFCASCCARFYDMNKKEAVCPKCKTPVATAGDETLNLQKTKDETPILSDTDLEETTLSSEELLEDTKDLDDEQDLAEFTQDPSHHLGEGV